MAQARSTLVPAHVTDIDVIRLVATELDPWMDDLRPLWDEWDRMWARWTVEKLHPDDPTYDQFLSKVQVPYGLYTVETIAPRIVGDSPEMNYIAVDSDQDDLAAMLLGKIVTQQMRRMAFDYISRMFIKQALVTNYTVAKVGWDRRVETQVKDTTEQHPLYPDNPEMSPNVSVHVSQQQKVVTMNEPFLDVVNVKDFAWPLTARSISDAPAVWQRCFLPLKTLRERQAQGFYQNVDDIVSSDEGRWSEAYEPQFASQDLTVSQLGAQPTDPMLSDRALIEVWERWEDDRLTVIAGRRILLHDGENPFNHKQKPFIDFTPIPRPFQLHGLGILGAIDDLQEHLNTLFRQICDAITYTVNPAFKGTTGTDMDDFVLRPGAFLPLEDTEDVEPLTTPNVDIGGAMTVHHELMNHMQKATGNFDFFSGNVPLGSHTATGVSTIVSEGTKRLQEMVNVFAYRAMMPFAKMMESNNAQFLDTSILVDFSDDPAAIQKWEQFVAQEQPSHVMRLREAFGQGTGNRPAPLILGRATIQPEWVKSAGTLVPIPQVGQDKSLSDTQKRSDLTQGMQAIAPLLAQPGAGGLNIKGLADYVLKEFDWPAQARKAVLETPPVQAGQQAAEAVPTNGSGPSGPSGDNTPTGGVVGTPGAAGPIGPPQVRR